MHTWVLFGQVSWKPKSKSKYLLYVLPYLTTYYSACLDEVYFPTVAFFNRQWKRIPCTNRRTGEREREWTEEMWFKSMISFTRLHIMGQSNAYVSPCECQRSVFSYRKETTTTTTGYHHGLGLFWTRNSHKKCSWNRFLISCTYNQHSNVDYLSFSHSLCFVSFFLFYYYYLWLLLLFWTIQYRPPSALTDTYTILAAHSTGQPASQLAKREREKKN